MSYETAVAQMYALGHELTQTPSHKFDLAHMRVLLTALEHPEKEFPSVLIAGTNGKGSTAAMLASIVQASGLKVALYTSPHLVHINERIRVNGAAISDDEFAVLHDVVDRTAERLVTEGDLPWHPSFFEMLTAMAFEHFAHIRPDLVILEVGMGGRLDATNVVDTRLSIITDIALDHQKYLGHTIREIAREKAGIIRPGGVVVTLPQLAEANDVIGNTVLEVGARAVSAVQYVPPVSPGSDHYVMGRGQGSGPAGPWLLKQRYPLQVMGQQIVIESPLVGRHQLRNIALAIAAAEELHNQGCSQITPQTIEKGIRETHWPGRFQVLPAQGEQPEFVFDVAHNPAGAWALRSTISMVYEDRPVTMVFGVMRDKAVHEIAEILFPTAEHVIATHAQTPRAASPQEIHQAASRVAAEVREAADVAEALEEARHITPPGGLVVVTGSIYIVGEAMRQLGMRI